MTTKKKNKKKMRLSTAIKHVLDLLDTASPESAALAFNLAVEGVVADLGYDHDEAVRMTHWIAGQSKDANWHDLEEEWCAEDRMPRELCNAAHENDRIPCAQCGTGLMICGTDGVVGPPNIFCPRCTAEADPKAETPLQLEDRLQQAARQKSQAPKTGLSLEEQRRILHETGLFDEMGNFKVPE